MTDKDGYYTGDGTWNAKLEVIDEIAAILYKVHIVGGGDYGSKPKYEELSDGYITQVNPDDFFEKHYWRVKANRVVWLANKNALDGLLNDEIAIEAATKHEVESHNLNWFQMSEVTKRFHMDIARHIITQVIRAHTGQKEEMG